MIRRTKWLCLGWMLKLTAVQEKALAIARRDGAVPAGEGSHGRRVEHVSAAAILALIRKGLLVHCYNSEGGVGGRLPNNPPQVART